MIEERNAGREARLSEERALLKSLPVRALPTHREEQMTVGRWGIIRVAKKPYSLPSRLIGHRVKVRLFADHPKVHYRELVARPERVCGHGLEGIDYRHLVHSLVRKPGAFRRYGYREALFPTRTLATLDLSRFPRTVRTQIARLAEGQFLEGATNLCVFGHPGTGKTHVVCALGHELVRQGHSVLFTPVSSPWSGCSRQSAICV
jgi:hypothetical protein